MVKAIESKVLSPAYVHLTVSSNRPNTTYATHCVPTNIHDWRNYTCFVKKPFDLALQPRVLIFIQNMTDTVNIARELDQYLPPEYHNKGIVKHYHGSMSPAYLEETHRSFASANGSCRILVATSAESTVLLFPW